MIEELINKSERIEYEIKIYKRNLIEEIEREEMISASNDLLLLRDLKEQQRTIQRIIKRLKMEKSNPQFEHKMWIMTVIKK